MKLLVTGVCGLGLLSLITLSGCGLGGGAKVAVGTTTLTNAPMTPDAPMPAAVTAVLAQADDADDAVAPAATAPDAPIAPPLETWGVRKATPEELSTYGF